MKCLYTTNCLAFFYFVQLSGAKNDKNALPWSKSTTCGGNEAFFVHTYLSLITTRYHAKNNKKESYISTHLKHVPGSVLLKLV